MKCSLCGVEAGGPASPDVALSIATNYPEGLGMLKCQPDGQIGHDPDWERRHNEALKNFVAVFGFHDQRAGAVFEVCGACLAERLKGSWRDRPALL